MERLLSLLFAPLLAAVPKKKKPTKPAAKRKSARPAKPARPRVKPARAKKIKPAARAVKKSGTRSSKPQVSDKAKGKHNKVKIPVQPTVVAKAEAGEPAPKPTIPTGRAILIAPENDKFTDSVHPTFRWLSVGGANRYEVVWGESPDLARTHSVISIATEAAVPVEKPLRIGSTYYWRVRGGNEGGWGPWSSSASFRVLEADE